MKAFAEINDRGNRINVYFGYSPEAVAAAKEVSGYKFVGKDKGGPFWTYPLDLATGQRLREAFGAGLSLGDALAAWGRAEVQKQRNLRALSNAIDADLKRLPEVLPELAEFISGRPYQRADIAMMAETNVMNANQPGTGKTIEAIGAIFEAGLDEGPQLVSAPVTAQVDPWVDELVRWQPHDVIYGDNPRGREWAIEEAYRMYKAGEPFWLILNPGMLRLEEIRREDDQRPVVRRFKSKLYTAKYPELYEIIWNSVTVDEFHKTGLTGIGTLANLGFNLLKTRKRQALSGTPMGGKPLRLFGTLQFLEPDEYTSKWRWAEQWLEIDESDFGQSIGGLQPGREDAFYDAHRRHIVRRLKREALPGLPDQIVQVVEVPMGRKHKAQYEAFHRDAEIRIDELRLSAQGVLAEYTRLKQFANAVCELDERIVNHRNGDSSQKIRVIPTADSNKWEYLLARLDENGIRKQQPEPGERAIVASQSLEVAEFLTGYLNDNGIPARELSGNVPPGPKRNAVLAWFKEASDEPRVLVMTTETGGVSLNLEMANSVHALDESWNPDDQEQLFDRADRGTRTTPLRVYIYRTKDTIQEYIAEVNSNKSVTNKNVLDLRRKLQTASGA